MKTIIRFNTTLQRTEYLYRRFPTKWIDKKMLCLKLHNEEAIKISNFLNKTGQEHKIIEIEGNH